jgi:hypothetical protein
MENFRGETDFWCFEGVVHGKLDGELELSALVNAVCRAIEGGFPAEQVVAAWFSVDVVYGFFPKISVFFCDPFLSRHDFDCDAACVGGGRRDFL